MPSGRTNLATTTEIFSLTRLDDAIAIYDDEAAAAG
jgi:hypothetical protein